jgi:cytochrome c1
MVALVVALAGLIGSSAPVSAADEAAQPPRLRWSFAGPFGKFDRGQLQRGYKVYREVCQVCHGMQLLSFRNLAEPGGPGFTPAQVAAVAAEYKVQEQNDDGKMVERPARPADHFPPPTIRFPGTTPPDMSVIAKARSYERGFPWFLFDALMQYQEHGVVYIVALLKGYENTPPAGVTLAPGAMYNKYFPGHAIAMPSPLSDKRVPYTDGAPETLDQYARDVSAFLMWAAEPHLEQRKRAGLQVMVFLIVFAGLLYLTKKKVWAGSRPRVIFTSPACGEVGRRSMTKSVLGIIGGSGIMTCRGSKSAHTQAQSPWVSRRRPARRRIAGLPVVPLAPRQGPPPRPRHQLQANIDVLKRAGVTESPLSACGSFGGWRGTSLPIDRSSTAPTARARSSARAVSPYRWRIRCRRGCAFTSPYRRPSIAVVRGSTYVCMEGRSSHVGRASTEPRLFGDRRQHAGRLARGGLCYAAWPWSPATTAGTPPRRRHRADIIKVLMANADKADAWWRASQDFPPADRARSAPTARSTPR